MTETVFSVFEAPQDQNHSLEDNVTVKLRVEVCLLCHLTEDS